MDTNPREPDLRIDAQDDAPAKFIRTFAADMEALKKGAAPALAPYAPAVSRAPEPRPRAAPRDISIPEQIEAVESTPASPYGLSPAQESRAPEARLVEGSVVPAAPPAPVTPAPVAPAPAPVPEGPAPLHTYSGDFSERIKDTGASQATVLAAEQDAGTHSAPPLEARSSILTYAASAVLLVLGMGGLYAGYRYYEARPLPVVLAPTTPAPIFYDEEKVVSGTGAPLAQAIEQSATAPLAEDTVRFLHFASSSPAESVFGALQLPAPGILLRNIDQAGSMAGVIAAGGAEAPFFILKVASYGDTFAGMLAWEPRMPSDLGLFYSDASANTANASSTPAASTTPQSSGWRDVVIANHDAREYADSTGAVTLVYGYWDQETLIIARDPAAFIDLVNRLASSHKS